MYYGLILLTTVIFGIRFALDDQYRRLRGDGGMKVSLQSGLIGAVCGAVILCIVNGFTPEFTPFTLFMALVSTFASTVCTYCGFKALETVNLSLYSFFTMLGGMVLPFLQGILFYEEGFTVAKAVCLIFVALSMLFTTEKGEKKGKKSGIIFCVGIFILNGMGGILTKIFTASTLEKASATDYSVWRLLCSIVIACIWLWVISGRKEPAKEKPLDAKSAGCAAVAGALNAVASCILVIALAHVDASVQYPMVSGGTMIVSTIFAYFSDKKPGKKDWIAVMTAFVGMLALFLIPV